MPCYNWRYMLSFKACHVCFPNQELKKNKPQNPKKQPNKDRKGITKRKFSF